MLLFRTKIRFLGRDIYQGTIKPIQRSLAFADKFSDEIKDKKQLQTFLGCLNYVSNFFPHLNIYSLPYIKDLGRTLSPGQMSIQELLNRLKTLLSLYLVCISRSRLHPW